MLLQQIYTQTEPQQQNYHYLGKLLPNLRNINQSSYSRCNPLPRNTLLGSFLLLFSACERLHTSTQISLL